MPAAPRLTITNLTRRFDGRAAVNGVSLTLDAGTVTCLLGPSGCGKSTVLRCVAGVDTPDGGEIAVDGVPLTGPNVNVPPEARPIGLMFQDFALFPHLTVAQNVAFGLRMSRTDRDARVRGMLDQVQIGNLAERYPHEISGGEQQRVALARTLAPGPAIVLMDEPFSGLDNRLRDGVRDETLELLHDAGAAVLLVTHEPEEAMQMGDRIALMRAGRVVQEGAPAQLFAKPVDRAAASFFSDINVLKSTVREKSVQTELGTVPAVRFAEGAEVDVVVRPQHIILNGSHGIKAKVERVRFLGRETIVETSSDDGKRFKASLHGAASVAPGQIVRLSALPENCLVFPLEHA